MSCRLIDALNCKRLMIRIATSFVLLVLVWTLGSAQAPAAIRVLTYNIHHGEGRDREFDMSSATISSFD